MSKEVATVSKLQVEMSEINTQLHCHFLFLAETAYRTENK